MLCCTDPKTKQKKFPDDSKLKSLERSIKELDHRLSSVEQPVWRVVKADETAWSQCAQGNVCRCLGGTKSLNCWNRRMHSVPVAQAVPTNTASIDLSTNALITFHKDTFRGLRELLTLDISMNRLNYIPKTLLWDLERLNKL